MRLDLTSSLPLRERVRVVCRVTRTSPNPQRALPPSPPLLIPLNKGEGESGSPLVQRREPSPRRADTYARVRKFPPLLRRIPETRQTRPHPASVPSCVSGPRNQHQGRYRTMIALRSITAAALISAAALSGAAIAEENPEVGGAPMLADRNIVENAVNSAD